jgi:hypothetical protein
MKDFDFKGYLTFKSCCIDVEGASYAYFEANLNAHLLKIGLFVLGLTMAKQAILVDFIFPDHMTANEIKFLIKKEFTANANHNFLIL